MATDLAVPATAPEPGEFAAPTPAEIERAREGVEALKLRLRDASPHRVWPARDGAEL